VHPGYFAHFFRTRAYRLRVSALAAGANINNLRNADLDDMSIPLPPLPEQQRIAGILDRADALRVKRRAALAQLELLSESLFSEMFGDLTTNSMSWPDGRALGEVTEIVSGITKGRPLNDQTTRPVPYLAVVNVQDRFLNLATVKTIEATETEVARYRLVRDDLLLTEGGDPDKLGRGTLWQEQLPECIHQNHIFRIRLQTDGIDPTFLNWLVGSRWGKRYFARSAKQTTGIATINSTQLRQFPLLVPRLGLQIEFRQRLNKVSAVTAVMAKSLAEFERLFAALQRHAFRGEL
jgi:type I restriction enzyme S subunit